MQIDEATKQGTATRTERDERILSMAGLGAEIGAAADGQTKAEGLRQMDAVVERSNLWRAIDQDEEFHKEDWSMSALRDRVELVRRFDQAVDEIRCGFLDLLDCSEVVEEVIMVPQVRKVIQSSAACC